MIQHYDDFVVQLMEAGFSMGGANGEGIFALVDFGWNDAPPKNSPIRWHTGDGDTDPWEWRIRVLDERKDIAYSKVFFKKSGYITKDWYPYFLAVRRGNKSLAQEFSDGHISRYAKRIYEVIQAYSILPLHGIKELAGFGKEEKAQFDRGLLELQMKMYLTMCGRQQKVSIKGEEYGWSSTVFCTCEQFWGQGIFEQASQISSFEGIEKITAQVLKLNPTAADKKILKFITG